MSSSIRAVAARAGVSPATVSRVLNNTDVQIAPPTRERVERAARELHYHPSAAARALVRQRTDTLGVVLPPSVESPLRNPFFSALLDGVLEAAGERRLNVMVFTAQTEEGGPGSRSLGPMRDGRCDGLLVFYQPPGNDILHALLAARIPCALVSDWRDDPRLPCVDVENEAAAFGMAEHLLGLGHRRIALLATDPLSDFARRRIAGFRRALRARGLPETEDSLVTGLAPWDAPSVFARIDALMRRPRNERPTALMCLGDDLAAVCLTGLLRAGLRVPKDVSLTGFNDDVNATRQHPALTTVRQPYLSLGGCAVDLLLERIAAGADAPARKLRLPTELIVRGSTAPPPEERTTK